MSFNNSSVSFKSFVKSIFYYNKDYKKSNASKKKQERKKMNFLEELWKSHFGNPYKNELETELDNLELDWHIETYFLLNPIEF